VVAERFGERHRDLVGDFVCCRHTLEHIAEPLSFLAMLRRVIGDRREVVVAFEVPDTRRVLDEGAFWDLYYEHCSYFTAGSLARLFRRCGLHPSSLRLEYGGQYLIVEGSPAPGPSEPLALEEGVTATLEAVDRFVDVCSAKLRAWTGLLREAAARRESVVLWGAGSKAVGFLTTLGIGREVDCVVDINPPKQGTYLPGSAHPIVAPAALAWRRPDTVIVMNPVYVPEISRDLAALGLEPRILPLV
jgi:hypothetical protein